MLYGKNPNEENHVTVEMLVDTAFRGPRKEGEHVEVPESYARRWVANGIAKFVEGKEDTSPYDGMTNKELYEMCIEKGLDVAKKLSKDEYIAALEAPVAEEVEEEEETEEEEVAE